VFSLRVAPWCLHGPLTRSATTGAALKREHPAFFLNLPAGPPPFSAMNSTRAASRAERSGSKVPLCHLKHEQREQADSYSDK
jgi:hypothetical protein